MTTGERITVIGLALVIAINVAVLVWVATEEETSNPLWYLGWLIPIGVMAWWLRSTLRGWRTRVRARAGGLKGKLDVVKASELAGGVVTVNDQPFLRLELELQLPGQPPERFTKRMVVPRLAIPAVMTGASFDVWVDPKDHRRFDVEW